jgi:hypothetical protein
VKKEAAASVKTQKITTPATENTEKKTENTEEKVATTESTEKTEVTEDAKAASTKVRELVAQNVEETATAPVRKGKNRRVRKSK